MQLQDTFIGSTELESSGQVDLPGCPWLRKRFDETEDIFRKILIRLFVVLT